MARPLPRLGLGTCVRFQLAVGVVTISDHLDGLCHVACGGPERIADRGGREMGLVFGVARAVPVFAVAGVRTTGRCSGWMRRCGAGRAPRDRPLRRRRARSPGSPWRWRVDASSGPRARLAVRRGWEARIWMPDTPPPRGKPAGDAAGELRVALHEGHLRRGHRRRVAAGAGGRCWWLRAAARRSRALRAPRACPRSSGSRSARCAASPAGTSGAAAILLRGRACVQSPRDRPRRRRSRRHAAGAPDAAARPNGETLA